MLDSRFSLSLALCALVLLTACDSGARQVVYEDDSASNKKTTKLSSGPAEPNWAELRKKVKKDDEGRDVAQREEVALDTLDKAFKAWQASKKATGAEAEKLLSDAKQWKQDAGDLYDMLEMDVEEVHPELMKKGPAFQRFQKRWDRYAQRKYAAFSRILMR